MQTQILLFTWSGTVSKAQSNFGLHHLFRYLYILGNNLDQLLFFKIDFIQVKMTLSRLLYLYQADSIVTFGKLGSVDTHIP